ncbi:MAG: alpha/beta fold hydrolase [Simkania negevensis]|nr:alpha/beta fold hydrolase [Simkania negevensis]
MKKKFLVLTFLLLLLLSISYPFAQFYYTQDEKLFLRKELPLSYKHQYSRPFQEVTITSDDGAKINAIHFTTPHPKGVVLYFHGRGGNVATNWSRVSTDFLIRGYDVLIMDYRGFGKSRGALSEGALLKDAERCYEYLLGQFKEEEIVVYGRSLGTGIATYLCSKHTPKMLLLESPYFSLLDLAPRRVPYLPSFLASFVLKYHFRTDLWITKVECPIHLFHGTADELVPYDSSLRLFKLIKHKLRSSLTTIQEGKHNQIRKHLEYQNPVEALLK